MKALLCFVVGCAIGFFLSHEADATLHEDLRSRVAVLQVERAACVENLSEAMILLDVQQQVLTRQLKVLEDVCPVVRRAFVPWPYCPPEAR